MSNFKSEVTKAQKTLKNLLCLDRFKVYDFKPGELKKIGITWIVIEIHAINWKKLAEFMKDTKKNEDEDDYYFIGGSSNSIFSFIGCNYPAAKKNILPQDKHPPEQAIIHYLSFDNRSFTEDDLVGFIRFLKQGRTNE